MEQKSATIAQTLAAGALIVISCSTFWRAGPWAVAASSLVFGLLHFQGGGLHGLFISAVTAAYGAVFAVLVIRSAGRLAPSIIAHMVVNGVGVVAALYLA
jgi:membrane protease YdiL (CAAX protease family)